MVKYMSIKKTLLKFFKKIQFRFFLSPFERKGSELSLSMQKAGRGGWEAFSKINANLYPQKKIKVAVNGYEVSHCGNEMF